MGERKLSLKKNKACKRWITLGVIILFLFNIVKFVNLDGNDHPLVSTLFNLIVLLSILVFILHKNKLLKEQLFRQAIIEDYFQKDN